MKKRLLTLLIALDIFVFALLSFGSARRNETMSAAAWRLELAGKWQGKFFRPLIDWVMRPLEVDHCHVSWLAENKPHLDVLKQEIAARGQDQSDHRHGA